MVYCVCKKSKKDEGSHPCRPFTEITKCCRDQVNKPVVERRLVEVGLTIERWNNKISGKLHFKSHEAPDGFISDKGDHPKMEEKGRQAQHDGEHRDLPFRHA